MFKRHLLALLGALVAPFPASAQITNYWGGASMRAGTTTSTSVTTSREQSTNTSQSFSGSAYTVTGQGISADGPLGPGQTYRVTNNDGSPFQFSLTQQEAGLVQTSSGSRTVDATTRTNSLSVFSEVGN